MRSMVTARTTSAASAARRNPLLPFTGEALISNGEILLAGSLCAEGMSAQARLCVHACSAAQRKLADFSRFINGPLLRFDGEFRPSADRMKNVGVQARPKAVACNDGLGIAASAWRMRCHALLNCAISSTETCTARLPSILWPPVFMRGRECSLRSAER